jgi:nucleoside-diphosphate-sugar epimerase
LYEDDFAAAIEQILENANLSGVVNVGNPRLIKIRTVVEAWGGSLNIKFKGDDRNELKVGFYPEIKKLSDIKWSPQISIEEGVQITKKSLQERFSQA